MFEEVMNQPNPSTDLQKLVDPRLGEDYPIDSVCKIAQLAKACTLQNHVLRPSMRPGENLSSVAEGVGFCSLTGSGITLEKKLGSSPFEGGISTKHTGITIDKSLEFSYNELAQATGNDWSRRVWFCLPRRAKRRVEKMEGSSSSDTNLSFEVVGLQLSHL
ncbi:hypothetical protein POM88_002768 [Heracleum sosnowskyi]|uniref:Uncharacterized protein n=1 Tax=Heracleum sosnowskyi TaxID=360622 RepID=A0AAD8JG65_9APIA|nr:hypothetical protein POM88_002768 [Heracleum sosnowskyi]